MRTHLELLDHGLERRPQRLRAAALLLAGGAAAGSRRVARRLAEEAPERDTGAACRGVRLAGLQRARLRVLVASSTLALDAGRQRPAHPARAASLVGKP